MSQVEGINIVIDNLSQFGDDFRKQLKINFSRAADVLYKQAQKNASVRDLHTKKWLETHGYPYAKRHGRPMIHTDKPYLVHVQSGDLLDAITLAKSIQKDSMYWYVWVDEAKAPHARSVIIGTKKMIGRPFLRAAFSEVHDKLFDIIRGVQKGVGGIRPLKQVVIERRA